ncbi:hypothetical protein EV143_10461 [Flavobacterium chryseum]|uniref:hypothetical protein n=1 Tax=Flavobacterium sp. P3160 TaxID=2512113 RepID=UPI00105EA3E2|nr:hypothetical protein [Flavobacterium sp. P3160]TDO77300.1 hypothetical protein EV143_10461 [Flavobacterium sp. P3160]
MNYKLTRTCKDCKHEDVFELTKIQCAFELYNFKEMWTKKCSNCHSTHCYSLRKSSVNLDKEILDIWGNDEKLYLNQQDEEIILAEMHYLPMILFAINEGKYLKRKIGILVESICILLYDNTVISNEFSKEENLQREKNAKIIFPELLKLKDKIEGSDRYIMDYIKEVVFPQLGINKKN